MTTAATLIACRHELLDGGMPAGIVEDLVRDAHTCSGSAATESAPTPQ